MIVKNCNLNADEQVIQKAVIEYDDIKIISNNTSSINLSYITSGKNNMIRSYIVARRKDQTARSVIGPSTSITVNEVGMPAYIRNTLTEKIFVNAFTVDKVKQLLASNQVKFYFNKRLNQLTRIRQGKFIKNKIHLLPGDWVEVAVQEYTSIILEDSRLYIDTTSSLHLSELPKEILSKYLPELPTLKMLISTEMKNG